MAYEQRDNSGTLFRNDDKRSDKSPDASGTALIDGKQYKIAGWIKEGKSGKRFTSLAFTPADEQPTRETENADRRSPPPARGRSLSDEIEDDLPF